MKKREKEETLYNIIEILKIENKKLKKIIQEDENIIRELIRKVQENDKRTINN